MWDRAQLLRATAGASLTLLLAVAVTGATDEGGVSWAERLARTMPTTPLCAAVGAWTALGPLRARGELLALEALGRSPAQIALAAVTGGTLVALLASIALATIPALGVTGFYPAITHGLHWVWTDGRFTDAAHGVSIFPNGEILTTPLTSSVSVEWGPAYGRLAAALSTALLGAALPVLLASLVLKTSRVHAWRTVLAVAGLAMAADVIAFQAAAAHRVTALAALVPAAALLVYAVRRYRSPQ